ncbi:conserved Plasmodium protein, unknown function [Plasmodium berghei]|uniref:Phytanoyl-CoA dioxygenase n=2 Tax=Plasmodium berghei TaxID=5821 RepID=A0A509AP05_PLABA|nr:conserved Plasmodium protein, unknown function [Plasmodium berghei ANKA]CXI59669.1 conserved Plasmodium protein, unknown function [Plasmodium berghei]SCM23484.1 conserved Plasmodium protein, unknown function [Plasmodium berghei]SCN26612.1 conserved Plasmodium protein, unknown function [Plasmodium berghei]SCO60879.1 conserved Plasmodium protein, unknown function [Plasmodium berghei]SCO62886.1 conserved Plasmodium protein, unknown function [Plasmodium berghei]|eukprot:XP_034422244.1 conserved Plasmodium protein, unknown function [Plasmodium berghei ANKA]
MNKSTNSLVTRFEYKYLFYALSFVSINLGICNEYIKKKKLAFQEKAPPQIYFYLSNYNFEYIDRGKYNDKIEKICNNFNVPISYIYKGANNYFPIDYHLQYLNNIFEKSKKKLKNVLEKENEFDKIVDKLVDEIVNHFNEHGYETTSLRNSSNSPKLRRNSQFNEWEKKDDFLKNLNFEHLKEFMLKRKKIIETKKKDDIFNSFIDELYAYCYLYLLINYKRNNFFDFIKIKRSYRHCSENTSKDIGIEINNYLGIGNENNRKNEQNNSSRFLNENSNYINQVSYVLNIDTINEIKKSLEKYGVVVLKNFLPKESVNKIKKELFLDSKNNVNVSPLLMDKDANVFCIRPTRGRQYCIIRNSKISDMFVNIQQYWLNIVYSYLPVGMYENIFSMFDKNIILNNTELNKLNIKSEYNDKLFISELQLLNNEPLSEIQSYHVDNGINGLSIIMPLNKINEESGNFEFFLGSHLFSYLKENVNLTTYNNGYRNSRIKKAIYNFKRFMNIYYQTGSAFIPKVQETDLIIYDSRIIHRGMSNNLWLKNSSLIYRYDYKKYPPPGQDFIDIISYSFIGKCISFFNTLGRYI